MNPSEAAAGAAEPQSGKLPVPPRLRFLLVAGIVIISAAAAVRFSPWAHEYQLQRASLAALRQRAADAPRDPLLFYYLGTKAYNARSLGEAGYCFQQATSLDPKMARAHVGLALVYRDAGQWDKAYASARQAQQLTPRDVDTQYLVAMLVMHASNSRAIPEFRKVTQMAPRRADAWYWLGVCQGDINEKAEGIEALKKAVSLEPRNPIYHRDLGAVLLERNFFPEARSEFETALRLLPIDAQTNYLLGVTRLKTARSDDDLRAAGTLMAKAQELLGAPTQQTAISHAAIYGRRAEVARRLRQPKEALGYLERARKLDARKLSYLYDQATVLRMLGQEDPARRLMDEYSRRFPAEELAFQITQRVKQDPKDPLLRLKLARLHAQNEDYAQAINQYEQCLYLDPFQTDARRELDALKKRLGAASKTPRAATTGVDVPPSVK